MWPCSSPAPGPMMDAFPGPARPPESPGGASMPLAAFAPIRSAPRATPWALAAFATLLVASPARATEVFFVRDCLEVEDALLLGGDTVFYAGSIGIRALVFSNLAPCSPLPAVVGSDADEFYGGQVDFQMSTDGGVTWGPAHAPVDFHIAYHYAGLAG